MAILSAGTVIAGCTSFPDTRANPAPTPVVPMISFAMGSHYLQNEYTFNHERHAYSEQLHIDTPSWGLEFNVTPISDNQQNGWFEITITNLDTQENQMYGYGKSDDGRTYPYDTYQRYPMYTAGSYQFDMKGNLVGVKVTIAKRLP